MVPIGVTGEEGHRGRAFTHRRMMPCSFRHPRLVLVVVISSLPNCGIRGLDQHRLKWNCLLLVLLILALVPTTVLLL